jgi:flagellar hook protein FlgE
VFVVDAVLMISSIGSAMSGMAAAVGRFDQASARIARPAATDLIQDRADQITAQHAFSANLATIRTADDMIGTLIDTVA